MVHRIAPPPEIEGLTWVRALGSGGFADVHLYRQSLPARDVAVKVVRDPTESGSVDEMHREADATAAVAGHPAVIELHGAGTTADGRPYLIMEYCPVADIGEQARARPMAVDRTLDLIIRVCGGVEALHRAGLVHRDIKPSNIMLDAYGRPVLADFGVAAPIGELEPGRLDGFSVLWAPPEQQDARTHAHPTQDVWALAATTWTLLTGRSPFEDPLGDNGALAVAHRVRSGRLRGLGRPDAPAQLEGVLRAAMALDPLERTGSALRLGEDLQGIQRIMGRPVTAMSIEPGGLAAEPVLPAADGSGAAVKTRQRGSRPSAPAGTRRRARPSVDPERTRMRAPSYDFQNFQNEVPKPSADDWEQPRIPEASTGEPVEPAGPRGRRIHPLGVVALSVVGAVAAAGLVIAMLTNGGRTTSLAPATGGGATGEQPGEAVDVLPLPVSALTGRVDGGDVVWTWVDGADAAGDGGTSSVGAAPGTGGAGADAPGSAGAAATAHPAAESYIYTVERPGQEERTDRTNLNSVKVVAVPGENCIEVVAVASGGRAADPVRECVQVP